MNPVLRLLWPFTRGRRLAVLGGVGGTVLVTAAQLARPFPMKLVVDSFAETSGVVDISLVWLVGGLVVGIALTNAVGTYASETWMQRTGEHVVHDLRVSVYAHLQRLSLRYHSRRQTGDLVTRITGDANAVGELVSESVVKVLGAMLLLVGMAVVSVTLDPVLTLVAAAITPLLGIASVRSRRIIKQQARRQRRAEGQIAALSTESLSAIATVKSLGTEAAEATRLKEESRNRRDAGVRGSVVEGRFGGMVDVLEAVGTGAVLVVGVFRVASGAVTPGDLIVMYSYVKRFYRPLRDLARQAGRISRALARAERISEVLAADDALSERADGHWGPRATGALSVQGVRFGYPDRPAALRDISFEAPAGTTIAIVGGSGAGKSTLAALLGRFYDPQDGSIKLDGHDLRDCKLGWVRKQVGFVLQDTQLFSGTVADNIAYGTEASRSDIVAAARTAGADEFTRSLPLGYDTPLGPDGMGLSGGQRQRLAIARTLLRDPALVVLDEPTSGLDPDTEQTVIGALERLLEGRTTVIITHSMRLAARADQVIVLEDGGISQDGPPTALLAVHGRFRQMATAQDLAEPAPLPVPADSLLPQFEALLNPGTVAERLRQQVPDATSVRVRYIRYKPGTNVVVDYEVTGAGPVDRVVLMAAADRDLGKRARRTANRELADLARKQTGDVNPLVYLEDDGVLVQWVPLDIWLPALSRSPSELASRFGAPPADDVELLAYKPRRRAVIRVGDVVIKLYADPADFRHAARALLGGSRLPVPTARPEGIVADLQMTAQHVVAGEPLDDPVSQAPWVGSVLARLHRAEAPASLRTLDPLPGALASARTVTKLVPELTHRTTELVERLARSRPAGTVTWCHGDFHRGQLLAAGDTLSVLDTDECGVGDPALDLATFAAHLHDGLEGSQRIHAVLDGLVEGYGKRPAGLEWHLSVALLRRSMSPFRAFPMPDWPDRVRNMLKAAEEVVT